MRCKQQYSQQGNKITNDDNYPTRFVLKLYKKNVLVIVTKRNTRA